MASPKRRQGKLTHYRAIDAVDAARLAAVRWRRAPAPDPP